MIGPYVHVKLKDVPAPFELTNGESHSLRVHISFMAAPAGHQIFACAIHQILKNVQNNTLSTHYLGLTGPVMFGQSFEAHYPEYYFEIKQDGHSHLERSGVKVIEKMKLSRRDDFQSGQYAAQWKSGVQYVYNAGFDLKHDWCKCSDNNVPDMPDRAPTEYAIKRGERAKADEGDA